MRNGGYFYQLWSQRSNVVRDTTVWKWRKQVIDNLSIVLSKLENEKLNFDAPPAFWTLEWIISTQTIVCWVSFIAKKTNFEQSLLCCLCELQSVSSSGSKNENNCLDFSPSSSSPPFHQEVGDINPFYKTSPKLRMLSSVTLKGSHCLSLGVQ